MSYLIVPKALGNDAGVNPGSQVDLRRLLDMIAPMVQIVNGGVQKIHFRPPFGNYPQPWAHGNVEWADGITTRGHQHDGIRSKTLDPGSIQNPTAAGERRKFDDYGIVRGPRATVEGEGSSILLPYMVHGTTKGLSPDPDDTTLAYVDVVPPIDFTEWLRDGSVVEILIRPMVLATWEFPEEDKSILGGKYANPVITLQGPSGDDKEFDIGDYIRVFFILSDGSTTYDIPDSLLEGVRCHWMLTALVQKKA